MKLALTIAILIATMSGCVIVPYDSGYRGDGYSRSDGYHRGDGYYHRDGYYRGDRYYGRNGLEEHGH